MRIELQSGLVGEARKIRGDEMEKMADRIKSGGGNIFAPVVQACWESTLDVGPYSFVALGDGKFDWRRVATTDLMDAMIQLRMATLRDGHLYSFMVRCGGPGCASPKYLWDIDLSQDLELRPISETARSILSSGGHFEVKVGGRQVFFDVRRVAQAEAIEKQMKALGHKTAQEPALVAMQLVRVDGLKSNDPRSLYRFALDLDWNDVLDLYEQMRAVEWGYNLFDLETRCPECGWEQEVALPFDPTFFRPSRSTKKVATESLAASPLSSEG